MIFAGRVHLIALAAGAVLVGASVLFAWHLTSGGGVPPVRWTEGSEALTVWMPSDKGRITFGDAVLFNHGSKPIVVDAVTPIGTRGRLTVLFAGIMHTTGAIHAVARAFPSVRFERAIPFQRHPVVGSDKAFQVIIAAEFNGRSDLMGWHAARVDYHLQGSHHVRAAFVAYAVSIQNGERDIDAWRKKNPPPLAAWTKQDGPETDGGT